jgi:hypothetical protein
MKQMLTTKSLDAMSPATTKRYEVRDQKVNGLHVRVSTTGAKVFYTMVRPNGARICRMVATSTKAMFSISVPKMIRPTRRARVSTRWGAILRESEFSMADLPLMMRV